MPKVEFLVSSGAKEPSRATSGAAGFDLYAVERVDIRPGAQATIDTGVAMAIPSGWCGKVMPRSGLATKYKINVHAGLIDSDYRGTVRVCLINHGHQLVEIRPGERIAQIVFIQHLTYSVVVDRLSETVRGDGGFGSTGL